VARLYKLNVRILLLPCPAPQVDAINASFVEAREEIEYAREDAETVRSSVTCGACECDATQRTPAPWRALLVGLLASC
jgi:hypothetical protein